MQQKKEFWVVVFIEQNKFNVTILSYKQNFINRLKFIEEYIVIGYVQWLFPNYSNQQQIKTKKPDILLLLELSPTVGTFNHGVMVPAVLQNIKIYYRWIISLLVYHRNKRYLKLSISFNIQ